MTAEVGIESGIGIGMGTILFLGTYVMPDRTPAALRALGLAAGLRDAGYRCSFGAGEIWEGGQWAPEGKCITVNGFPVVSLAELGGPSSSRWRRALLGTVLRGRGALRWLASQDLKGVRAVIANGGYSPLLLRLLPFLRSRAIPLIVDIADWYDPAHMPGGRMSPYWWQVEFAMRVLHKKCGGIIAVSRLLARYYGEAGVPVTRVPPTTDTGARKWLDAVDTRPRPGAALRLVYAGAPGKKDDLATVVCAVKRASTPERRIVLTFVGPSCESVRASLSEEAREDFDSIETSFTGFVCHERVPAILATHDFSVLVRPSRLYANAGFPTKLVESLCAGVPMIVNGTSDILDHVRDGQEGLVVPEHSLEDLTRTLIRAAAMTHDERETMRRAARSEAVRSFDNRVYSSALANLVERTQRGAKRRGAS